MKKIQEAQNAEIQIPHLEKEIHELKEIKFVYQSCQIFNFKI